MFHHTQQIRLVACHQLIEDMVAPLSRQLEGDTGLLQQIYVQQSKVRQKNIACISSHNEWLHNEV